MGLIQRLKERKLVQWGIAYLCGAWVFVEATNLVVEQFSWRQIVGQVVTILAFFGFFVVLVLAWYHGEKGRQKVSGPELLMVAALLVVAGVALSTLGGGEEAPEPIEATAPGESEDTRPSLAVLPLDNLSPDPQDAYFADGVHEDITTALARISSLSVRARSSVGQYRESRPGAREIAAALGVDFLLEGSARIVGTMAKVTVQLIDGRLDEHAWQDEWEVEYLPDEAIRIQGEIAREVATRLRIEITPEEETRLSSAPTEDPEAQRLYHRARYLWNQRTEPGTREAIRLLEEAVGRDSTFAEAFAGLADALVILGAYSWALPDEAYPGAIAAAEQALALDPSLAAGHASLGNVGLTTRDWEKAEDHFRRALALDPDHAYARYWYSLLLDGLGRHDEAGNQAKVAMELDPLSPQIGAGLHAHYYATRDFDRAIAEAQALVRTHPEFANGWLYLADAYMGAGRFEEAMDAKVRGQELLGEPSGTGLALLLAYQGDREGALMELDRALALKGPERINPINIANVYIGLGEFDEAFRLLNRAKDEGRPSTYWLTYEFVFDPIRSDPRFIALMEELNLPVIEYQ